MTSDYKLILSKVREDGWQKFKNQLKITFKNKHQSMKCGHQKNRREHPLLQVKSNPPLIKTKSTERCTREHKRKDMKDIRKNLF